MNQTAKSADPAIAAASPPRVRRPRRWLRRTVALTLMALILMGGWSYLRHLRWERFQRDVVAADGDLVDEEEVNENLIRWIPRWTPSVILDWPPFISTWTSLECDSDKIDDDWMWTHRSALHDRVADITLRSDTLTDAGLRALRNHKSLWAIRLECNLLSPDCLVPLGHLPELFRLEIPDVPLSVASVKQLASASGLTQLECAGASPGLSQLGLLRKLEMLDLVDANDESIQRLPENCAVQYLVLLEGSITDKSIPHLLKLASLREILFGGDCTVTVLGLSQLRDAGLEVNDPNEHRR